MNRLAAEERRPNVRWRSCSFGYTILYVRDVAAALDFYERAFEQKRRFLHEERSDGELDTGAPTTLGVRRPRALSL